MKGLIEENMDLVKVIARGIKRKVPSSVEFEDLVSEGYVGLVLAAQRGNISNNFRGYAYSTVKNHIVEYLRGCDFLSNYYRKKVKNLKYLRGVFDDEDEIIQFMGERDYHQALSDSSICFKLVNEEDIFTDVDEEEIKRENIDMVRKAMSKIQDLREISVLNDYFFLNKRLNEIGERLGVTESMACRIKQNALKNLKTSLITYFP